MTDFDRDRLCSDLIGDDGVRLKPYRDIKGKLMIGVGRNLDDVGISRDEAAFLLDGDLTRAEGLLDANASWWRMLDPVRQGILMNMVFDLGWGDGIHGLSSFQNMLRRVQAGDYVAAGQAMLASGWASQVGGRVMRLSRAMASGMEA
jgi:lysozyme